jgi:hypothetical protein
VSIARVSIARVSIARVSIARVSIARVSIARVSIARVDVGEHLYAGNRGRTRTSPESRLLEVPLFGELPMKNRDLRPLTAYLTDAGEWLGDW